MKTKYRYVTEKDLENLPLECLFEGFPDSYAKRIIKYKLPNGKHYIEFYNSHGEYYEINSYSSNYICSNYKIKEEIKTIELFECWNSYGEKHIIDSIGRHPLFDHKEMSSTKRPSSLTRKTGCKVIIDAESFEIVEVQND
jgi:hypothetical protein